MLDDEPLPDQLSSRWRRDVPAGLTRSNGSWRPAGAPLSARLLYDDPVGAEFAHAWELKDVQRWLYAEGLEDAVAAFRSAKIKGEDLIKLTPAEVAGLFDDKTMAMRVCGALHPLKRSWKRSRQAAGLKINLNPAIPKHDRLLAELHVLVDGAAFLPPGSSGAYIEICTVDNQKQTPHKIKTEFMPVQPAPIYYEASRAIQFGAWPMAEHPHPHSGTIGVTNPTEPQTFRLPIDEKAKKDLEKIRLTVVAWLPQLGEREVGKVEIPIPDAKDGTFRVRMEEPVRAELCWIAYPAPATKKVDDWEKVDAPAGKSPQLTGAWYTSAQEVPWYPPMPVGGGAGLMDGLSHYSHHTYGPSHLDPYWHY